MAPVSLLTLAPELFNLVIEAYAAEVPLHELFRARVVCSKFRKEIDHVLLANTTAEVYTSYEKSIEGSFESSDHQKPSGVGVFLQKNLQVLLFNHCKKNRGMNPSLPNVVKELVDDLMQFTSIKSEDTKDAYLGDACQAFADLNPEFTLRLLHGTILDINVWAGPASIGVLLAAAAAVGNAEAVEHYLVRGGEPIGHRPNTDAAKTDYDRPMEAAASTGKTLIVRRLLEVVGPRFDSMNNQERYDNFNNLIEAARLAAKAGDADSAYLLLKFVNANAREQIRMNMFVHGDSFLVRTTNSGCLRFVGLVTGPIAAGPDLGRKALPAAVRAGYTDIVQFFLEKPAAATARLAICKKMMPLAVYHGHRVMVELFRGYGVDLQSEHFMDCLRSPSSHVPLSTRPRGCIHMVQHLLKAGVAVDGEVFKRCEEWASNVLKARHDFKKAQSPVGEGAMITIIIAREAMSRLEKEDLKAFGSVKLLLKLVLNGKIKVPTAPLPFEEMAKEVHAWLMA